jgi:hypothetical protein
MVKIICQKITETYPCTCGNGNIVLVKRRVSGTGHNQSQPKEGITSIKACRACGSTIDSNGNELDKRKN